MNWKPNVKKLFNSCCQTVAYSFPSIWPLPHPHSRSWENTLLAIPDGGPAELSIKRLRECVINTFHCIHLVKDTIFFVQKLYVCTSF